MMTFASSRKVFFGQTNIDLHFMSSGRSQKELTETYLSIPEVWVMMTSSVKGNQVSC